MKDNKLITLLELSEKYYEIHNELVGKAILSRACKKLGLVFKKLSHYAKEQEREDVKKTRRVLSEIFNIPLEKLVFLDESGANLNMSCNYGWGLKCERIKHAKPHQRGTKFSILVAIGLNKI